MRKQTPKRNTAAGRRTVMRTDVLQVAARLFSEQGYRATSLGLVAAELGVTRQALYYHFSSKDEILAALFEQLMTRYEVAVLEALAADEPEGVTFARLVRAHADTTVENAELVTLLTHERPEIDRLTWLRPAIRRRDYARLFVEAYAAGVERGELLALDPWIAVNTVIAAVNGAGLWYHGDHARSAPSHEVSEQLATLLTSGVLASPAQFAIVAA